MATPGADHVGRVSWPDCTSCTWRARLSLLADHVQTNDQTIVALCVSLTQNTHAHVVLVSDDTNARMHAESEGLPTTSPEELYRVLPRDRAAAQQLLMLSCSPEHRDLICHPRALAALAPGVWEHLGHLWDGLAGAVAPAGPEEDMIE